MSASMIFMLLKVTNMANRGNSTHLMSCFCYCFFLHVGNAEIEVSSLFPLVRVNSYNNKVIMVEDLSPDMVQVSSQKVGFKPNEALANIHLVLTRLKNQLPGHYLLDLKRGERSVNLKVAVDASKTGIENMYVSAFSNEKRCFV